MELSNWEVPYLFGFFWLAISLAIVWSPYLVYSAVHI